MNMIIRIWKENSRKPITKLYSDRTRRFSSSVVPDSIKKAYLKVSYGNKEDVSGEKSEFFNDGEYYSKKDLLIALRNFMEEFKKNE